MSKKEKVILTPEQKAERAVQRKLTAKLGFKEGIIPFFIQFGILVVVILLFAFGIANDAIPLVPGQTSVDVAGEQSNPNWVRLIYMLLTIPGTILLLKWSSKIENKKKAFWPALIAGIVAWQGLGECSWHFSLPINGVQVNMPPIEGFMGSALIVFFVPVIIYVLTKTNASWTMKIFLLSFLCNWVPHWLLLGIAPMWWNVGVVYHIPAKWPKLGAFLFGLHGSLMILYKILFKAKSTEERLVLSVLLYAFVGTFAEGLRY